jgi:pyridoxine 5-phosphate synthase
MILLGVNIDHVATLRQARGTRYPDPVQAAIEAEQAGADGITVHLREDRRHIQERDIDLLRQTIETRLNLEMAPTDEMLIFAESRRPQHVCLVPERREELTTEGGLDVINHEQSVSRICKRLADIGVQVSLFINPREEQIDAAVDCGAAAIEIHTGYYADAANDQTRDMELERILAGIKYAKAAGLIINAGHGLNYHNVGPIAAIPEINELNIGHAIVARSIFVGMQAAVKEMKALMLEARLKA